jgi:hypothetical protein
MKFVMIRPWLMHDLLYKSTDTLSSNSNTLIIKLCNETLKLIRMPEPSQQSCIASGSGAKNAVTDAPQ